MLEEIKSYENFMYRYMCYEINGHKMYVSLYTLQFKNHQMFCLEELSKVCWKDIG